MVTAELGACEWFVWDLRRSNLIDRGQLDQVVGEYLQAHPGAEPSALAQFLVEKAILSQFQAERLLQGKTQGFVLGPFTLMDALGAGSMGTVYKALSKNDQKWYAVKVLPRRSMWNVRIARRKVRAFEACKHPAVVPFVDVGTAGSMHYLAWPYVEGEGLDKFVQAKGKLKPGMAANLALQVVEALEVCHQQALFHGMLKPSNLMVGAEGQIYILDFGIGCLLAETEGESLVDTMSTANSVASGLDCASPESIMDPSNLTPAGDQYSLGCVLYYCLTGQYPFPDGTSAEKMMAHQFKEPAPLQELNPDVPAELADVVKRLMQKAPENRYANAAEVVEVLRPLSDAPRLVAPPAPPPLPTRLGGLGRSTLPASKSGTQAPETRSVSVGAPTPRPAANLTLPNRKTMRGGPAAPTQVNKPSAQGAAEQETQARDDLLDRQAVEARPSQLGVVLVAVAACAATWLLMTFLL